ncbi:MAG: carotenoid biosynthesis protein [Pseudomonadota bacterium]
MERAPGTAFDTTLWAVILLWLLVTLASFFMPSFMPPNTARFINVGLLSAFTLLHGSRRYGAGIAVYFLIAVVVTNVFENMSIISGFPFGAYHHTAAMGPQLWHVPIIVGPIFAVAGYIAWVIAGILLGDVFSTPRGVAFGRSIIAAFLTTSWDLCVDAIGGTANRDWVWANGGPWFGVPLLNFFGWMLTMWVTFQLFALFLTKRQPPEEIPANAAYWRQPVVYWLLIGLQFPLLAFIVPAAPLSDPTGQTWGSGDLFQSMALISVFTMIFTALLTWLVLARHTQRA